MDPHAQRVVFSSGRGEHLSKRDAWQTPWSLFHPLLIEFSFTIDGAANEQNTLLSRWWGPHSILSENALTMSWEGERVWCNPPYSQAIRFVEKAYYERFWSLSVLLVPSRTDTKWWHEYVWNVATQDWRQGVRGRFIRRRVRFVSPDGKSTGVSLQNPKARAPRINDGAPFPSVLLIFGHNLHDE